MNSPIVSLDQVTKSYKTLTALNNMNLTLNQGEVLGLFGHNGAGKTTLMKLILGVISPSHGKVSVLGYAPDDKSAWHCRKSVGYLPENVSFYDQLSGLEVLTYFAKLKGYAKKDALDLLEQVGLSHAMKRQVKTYSKGMRQRLGLAQAFIGEPKLLLLDEPTVGLDPIATSEFYQTVDQLKTNGASIILCSHVLPGVEQHIDRAVILSSGDTLAMGTITELRQQASLPVKIKPHGLNGSLSQIDGLKQLLDVNNQTLLVPESEKIAILKQVLSHEDITDVSVEPASLNQLYQYFLNQPALGNEVRHD